MLSFLNNDYKDYFDIFGINYNFNYIDRPQTN